MQGLKNLVSFERVDIDTPYCASLCWHGDHLLDILGSGISYFLDGTQDRPSITRGYAYKFDSVISNGRYAVLYEAHGTKALIIDMETSSDIRQLDRPYYHANDYHFPITMFKLPNGNDVIAHCPTDYNALDIEDVLSGERLTKRDYESPDIFHSNLAACLDGKFLLDRGWVWHPLNILNVYDIEKALADPKYLDGDGIGLPQSSVGCYEPETATFCAHNLVYSSFMDYVPDTDEPETGFDIQKAEPGVCEKATVADDSRVRRVVASELSITDESGRPVDLGDTRKDIPDMKFLLQVFDLGSNKLLSSRQMPMFLGRMMSVGEDHVVSFYDHPKLIEISTGKVVQRWEDLFAGPEVFQPSAMSTRPQGPFLALDSANKRFAIGSEKKVSIVSIKGP